MCLKVVQIVLFKFNEKMCSLDAIYYSDVMMGAMAFQITGVSIVCSTVCSGADQKETRRQDKIKTPRHWPFWGESTGGFPSQRSSNVENVSIWWCHQCDLNV